MTYSGSLFGSTFSPPTPNGDFHLGHFAGPVLGSDICARALRRAGAHTRYICSTDDNQTYVVTTADRMGVDPTDLLNSAYRDTTTSLQLAGISVDGYHQTDIQYNAFVAHFLTELHGQGAFDLATIMLPFDTTANRFLTEAFVTGRCPHCLAAARAGVCEACGLYNLPDALLPTHLQPAWELRPAQVWMLDLERHRALVLEELDSHHTAGRDSLRRVIAESLRNGPLPQIPITYPIDWGIPVQWGGVEGVINAWPEIFVGHLYWLGLSGKNAEPMTELIQFIGIDNGFYNAFVYSALAGLARRGGVADPPRRRTITNNYLQLGGRKFSTSKGDVIWAGDFLREVGRDRARFVLALKAPDYQNAEFTRTTALETLDERFDKPLRALSEAFVVHPPELDAERGTTPHAWWFRASAASRSRFDEAYAPATFSIRAAAEAVALHVETLALGYTTRDLSSPGEMAGAMQFYRELGEFAAPVVPDLAESIAMLFSERLVDAANH